MFFEVCIGRRMEPVNLKIRRVKTSLLAILRPRAKFVDFYLKLNISKYTQFTLGPLGRDTLQSIVFWLGGSHLRLPDANAGEAQHPSLSAETDILEPHEAFIWALTLSRGTRLLAWNLGRPFSEECRMGWRHYWNLLAYVDYGTVPDTHNKMASCQTPAYVRRSANSNKCT